MRSNNSLAGIDDTSNSDSSSQTKDASQYFFAEVYGERSPIKLPEKKEQEEEIDFGNPWKMDLRQEAPKAGQEKGEGEKPKQEKVDQKKEGEPPKAGPIKLEAKDFEKLGPEVSQILKSFSGISVQNIQDGKHFELTRSEPLKQDMGNGVKLKMGTTFAADVKNLGSNKLLVDNIAGLSIEVPTPDNKAFGQREVQVKKISVEKDKSGNDVITLTTSGQGQTQDIKIPIPPGNAGLARTLDTLRRVASTDGTTGGDPQKERDLLKDLTLGLIGLGVSGIVGGAAIKMARAWRNVDESKSAPSGDKASDSDRADVKPAADGAKPAPDVKPAADGAKPAPDVKPAADGAKPVPEVKPAADGVKPAPDGVKAADASGRPKVVIKPGLGSRQPGGDNGPKAAVQPEPVSMADARDAQVPNEVKDVVTLFRQRGGGRVDLPGGEQSKPVKFEVQNTGVNDRALIVDKSSCYLSPTADAGWFRPDGMPADKHNGATTVNVGVTDVRDLARVQATLLPKIAEAMKPGGALHGKLADVATQDPMQTLKAESHDKAPENGNVGVKLYPVDAAAAKDVQQFLDKALVEAGLRSTDVKLPAGDVVRNGSGRVSAAVHDYEPARYSERDPHDPGAKTVELRGSQIPADMENGIIKFMHKQVESKAPGWEKFATVGDLYKVGEGTSEFTTDAIKALEAAVGVDGKQTMIRQSDPVGSEVGKLMLVTSGAREAKGHVTLSEVKESVVDGPHGKQYHGLAAMHNIGRVVSTALNSDAATPLSSNAKADAEKKQPVAAEDLPVSKNLLSRDVSARFVDRVKAEGPFNNGSATTVEKLTDSLNQFLEERVAESEVVRQVKFVVEFAKEGSPQSDKTTVRFDAIPAKGRGTYEYAGQPVTKSDKGFFSEESNRPVKPNQVQATIRLPESLLKDPEKLAKEMYRVVLENSASATLTTGQNAGIDAWMETSFGVGKTAEEIAAVANKGTEPDINLPRVLPELADPLAKLTPEGVLVGNGRTELKFTDVWEKAVEHLENEILELKRDAKNNAEEIRTLEQKLDSERKFQQRLKTAGFRNDTEVLKEAHERIGKAVERVAKQTVRPGAEGLRSRAVAFSQIVRYLRD